MRTFTTLLLLVFLSTTTAFAATVRATVTDAHGRPLAGVTVTADGRSVTTDATGAFTIDVAGGSELRIAHPGFEPVNRRIGSGETIALAPAFAETMEVSGIRAEAPVPVTKTDIGRERIEREYHGQDIPLLLRDAPSVNAWSESGAGGSGYSYFTLRGISPTRINFTLDGVPLADSEDMGTYFADFPDLARSLQSVQIQRGVGTSTVGSPSFGGSVNLQSIDLAQDQRLEALVGAGSYGSRQTSVAWQSGALPGGFSIYSRLSFLESDGYRDHAGIDQRNLFLSAAKQVGEGQLKLTGFTGHEDQQLAWYASDRETLLVNPRDNPLREDETDSFGYDLAQLQYIRPVGSDADMTASVYYQRGYGWYTVFDYVDEQLREYGLDGMLMGSMLTYSRRSGALTTQYGLHVNRFKRDHTRDIAALDLREYSNYGVKSEANAFAKVSYDVGRWHLYGDGQLRTTDFAYHGDQDLGSIRWTFFNPRLGARYTLTPATSVYASAGMSTREPARNDLFHGEDNPSIAYDLRDVKPERVFDYEAGVNYISAALTLAANVYAMEFRNEIAATGELSEIGLALRRNVDRSYRRGIELEATWQATPSIRLRSNANVSRNRISEWTQFYDVYDEAGSWLESKPLVHRDVNPVLTPWLLLNQAVEYTPHERFSIGAAGRYAGKAYLDNTNNEELTTPAFFVADANVSVAVTKWARLSLQVNNLFDRERVWPNGYSYLYLTRAESGAESIGGTPYYYPQAGRNAMLMLEVGF
ncbi:MAG TPA: TonB-dependent receptor [Thermoanaerobaculia bacterium]|jgi:iron complex outermembrane receptor protein